MASPLAINTNVGSLSAQRQLTKTIAFDATIDLASVVRASRAVSGG